MKMSYSLDVEAFIQEVEKYPDIWNVNSEGNRHRSRKMAAWANIARVFISDFDDLAPQEKTEVYTKLFSKWRNIRDQYVRHRKNKIGNKKGYLYDGYLHFLESVYSKSHSYDQDGNSNGNENETQDWSDDGEEKLKRIGFVSTGTKDKPRLEISSDHWTSEDATSPSLVSRDVKNKKQKRQRENSINIEYVETPPLLPDANCSYQMEDEDKSFFDSLLPAVRDLDIDQKLEFRSEVLKLLRTIRCTRKRIKRDPEDTVDLNMDDYE